MLDLINIKKIFNKGSAAETVAIENLCLSIEQGDFITVIGGNGAGKSTMLNIISGSIDYDEGIVSLNGNDISFFSEHKRAPYFGRVFQDPMMGTAPDMTIMENLSLAYRRGKIHSPFLWSTSRREKEYLTEQVKSLGLGLENKLNQKVGLLSGGQRQAITLLMATLRHEPSPRVIKRDYVRFVSSNKKEAKIEVIEAVKAAKTTYLSKKREILLNLKESPKEKRAAIAEAKQEFRKAIEKYDLTKQILLLDEHTAALDPKTAAKVLELTKKVVEEKQLTTIMITHNMKDAIKYGNRLIMLSKGKVIYDVRGEEKSKLTVKELLDKFTEASKDDYLSDATILG